MRAKFIAEVSSNHSGDLDRALEFIDKAADIGCDAVKFQLFRIQELFAKQALIAKPELLKRKAWELPYEFLEPLSNRCKKREVEFCCTPFDLEAVELLTPYVSFFKVASYELLWLDLIKKCARSGKPIVLSTGMADLKEIANAIKCAIGNGCKELSIMHCVSGYPTPINQCNLGAIGELRKEFDLPVGWSDHSVNRNVVLRAIQAWGAEQIEFHLDLDGKGEEYESGHCWLPSQMKEVIDCINEWTAIDGNGIKVPVPAEIGDRDWRADPTDGLRPLKKIRAQLYIPR